MNLFYFRFWKRQFRELRFQHGRESGHLGGARISGSKVNLKIEENAKSEARQKMEGKQVILFGPYNV